MHCATTIKLMTTSDVPAAVDLLYQHKISLAINRVMWKTWPDETVQKARIRSAFEESMRSSSTKCYKAIEDHTGDVLGILVLTHRQPPSADVSTNKETSHPDVNMPQTLAGLNLDILNAVTTALDIISEDVAGIDHQGLYCSLTRRAILMIRQKSRRL